MRVTCFLFFYATAQKGEDLLPFRNKIGEYILLL